MTQPIRIILVEDHAEYREVIEMALRKEADLELIDQFGTAEMALRKIENPVSQQTPDIVLLDLNLPGMSGLEALPWFQKYSPHTKIMILSQSDKENDVYEAILQGASGYLLKSSTIRQIKEGIRSVINGGSPLDANVASYILKAMKSKLPKPSSDIALSNREMETLILMADGLSKKEIADQLGIGATTVVTHVNHIYQKLNAANAPAAVSNAYEAGILPLKKK